MRDRDFVQRFGADRSGSVALIFAFSLVVLFGVVGLAVDMSRAYSVSTRISSILDAATLAGAKKLVSDTSSEAEVETLVRAMITAHHPKLGVEGLTVGTPRVLVDRSGSSVAVDVDIRVPTTFAQVIGVNGLPFTKSAASVFVQKRVELAMVLDITGSMNDGGKLAAMKLAAKDVVDALIDPTNPTAAKIALVPYSAAVNTGPYAAIASGGDSLDGCVMERLFPGSRDTDDVTGGSRNFAVKGQLNSTGNANPQYGCPLFSIAPLSAEATTLKSTIDSYDAGGATAGHLGLSWGWNLISPKWSGVFTGTRAPGPYNDTKYIKAVLLMTDGEFNTAYTGGTSPAEQIAESTNRTLALCTAMKAQKIALYTVAFQAPGAAVSLLQSCATSTSHAYDTSNSSQLLDAFRSIVADLQQVRIQR
jgi:Flp pilus assembly protein TadG